MSDADVKYMRMALKLAAKGTGSVEPNPAVGAVIVKANRVVGRGWHKKFGGPHAEINALADCRGMGVDPAEATMYVTLEPCCHRGKTGPCSDAIIEAKMGRVVIAMVDPAGHANGRGIEQLENAGIKIEIGLCEREAKILNAPFIKFAKTGRPWVVVKWAQSIDGKLAWADASSRRWISGEKSRADAHNLRRRASAVLVGVNTVLADDPLLTARPARGKKPVRIVLDSNLRIPLDSELLRTAKKSDVVIVTTEATLAEKSEIAEKLIARGAKLMAVTAIDGRCDISDMLRQLGDFGIRQLLVEGGPAVIGSFLSQQVADELCVYVAPMLLGAKGSADITKAMVESVGGFELSGVDIEQFGDDVCIRGLTQKAMNELVS